MTNVDRREAMAVSLAQTGAALRLPASTIDLVGRAYDVAMRLRVGVLDEHDPAFLHPGRSAIVLLRDVGPLPGEVLAAAVAHESQDARFRQPIEHVRAELGDEVARLVASVPLPGDQALIEGLVTLDENARLVALAERLDHLRHAHLRHDPEWWRTLYAEVETAWAPVAERTHPRLADRYRAWLRAMGRRLGTGRA